ncbi:beta-glucosidase [Prevotella sp. CAG:924]|nr:beta-glucosidase [Prevotella sp. CAG:924]
MIFAAILYAVAGGAQTLPYQNPNLSAKERATDLCGRLTLEEKASLMQDQSNAIPRLGIPQFAWWSEALHGVGRNGFSTVFPSCIGMAASFDDALLERIYTAVSDEARAKNTAQRRKGSVGRYQGLSFWTPNINIFRDPRWGRGQETYGEDPYMNSRMGLAVVRGLQGPAGHKYAKLYACAKHFAVHSGPEKTRHHFNIEDLSPRDLWETYLPAFKDLVQIGGVKEVMCAYQRFEGEPCCGSNKLLRQILRDEWGFRGLVVSDCGAISDFWMPGAHGVSPDARTASAKAVLSGTDLECGSNYQTLPEAVKAGAITEEQIDRSVTKLLEARFELGDFDPDSLVEWTRIPESVIACQAHKDLALTMAREQMVLLHNKDNTLPLEKDASKIVVMGPNAADSTMMWGIYYGQPTHTVTVLEGIRNKLGPGVRYVKGCDITTMTENESIFRQMTGRDGKAGMSARFWNNSRMEGTPVYEGSYSSHPQFDTGGNTVFAPGVALTGFSARFDGKFTARKTETLSIRCLNDGKMRLIVNGDTLAVKHNMDEVRLEETQLKVKAGTTYDIRLDYVQFGTGASLGFDVSRIRQLTIPEVTNAVGDAGTVVFIGGISPNLEREEAKVTEVGFDNGDRTSIELPAVQRDLLKALHEAGKKVVLVNCSGSAVALTPELQTCDAILQAWYPGEQGGTAVADVLFGDYNPGGKLPVTFYKDDSQLPPFDDYDMANRTYRYFKGAPLFPFGYGLSYTTFKVGTPAYDATSGKITVKVSNTGKRDGVEIVQAYMRNTADTTGPLKSLRGFARVSLNAGETKTVEIDFPRKSFEGWDVETNTMRVVPGKYDIMVGTSSADQDLNKISVDIQ